MKVYAPLIFDSDQFAKVYSSRNVCHLAIRESLCQKFRKFFSSQNFREQKVSAPKLIIIIIVIVITIKKKKKKKKKKKRLRY